MNPPPICSGSDGLQCAWDAPLTRLMLLLEIAGEPDWLRDVARLRADDPQPYGQTREGPEAGAA